MSIFDQFLKNLAEEEESSTENEDTSRELQDIAKEGYLNYAMSVITSRALPDVRDGLKPVQRRILYSMFEDFKLTYDKKHRKSAAVAGTIMGKYHAHGDSSIYEAMVRLSQEWVMRLPLVDGHGNFGNIDGDKAAAPRYTEVRLQPVLSHLIPELKKDTVEFVPNYDNTTVEPKVLPVTLPLMLINGATGIAVGMATNIPPHNVGEVIDASIDLLRNPTRQVETLITKHILGPDFPTGGIVLEDSKHIASIYSKGQGSVTIRSKWHIEKEGRKTFIVITEIPYGVVKQDLVEKIARYVINNELPLVNDIRDESTKDIRIVLEIKSSKDEAAIMAFLLKHTQLESKFHLNLTALVPENDRVVPKRIDLKEMINHFLDFRKEVVKKSIQYDIQELSKRIHILEGFVIVLGETEKAIQLVMKAKSKEEARQNLLKNFKIDAEQADQVLNTRIYRLANYETLSLKEELQAKTKERESLQQILDNEESLKDKIIQELKHLKKNYAEPRKTVIGEEVKSFEYDESAYIEDSDVVVVLSRGGWFRRQKSYTSVENLRVRDGDSIGWVLKANTKESIIFFSNKGKAFTTRVHDLPETTGHGDPIQSMFTFEDGERVVSCWTESMILDKAEAVAVSSDGNAVRFDLDRFKESSQVGGRSYIRLEESHTVVSVEIVLEDSYVVVVSYDAKALSFPAKDVPKAKGVAKGSKTLNLSPKDSILAFGVTTGARGGSLVVETGQGTKHEIRHTTYGVGRRGQKGKEVMKRGTFVKWHQEVVTK